VRVSTPALGPLQVLLDQDDVTEIIVNGPGAAWVERHGVLHRTDVHLDLDAIELLIERVLGPTGRRVDRRVPFVDARLPDGSRVNVVVPPVALDGPCVTIRRFARRAPSHHELLSPVLAAFTGWAVAARANILISGGAGAGKTTLLNALASCIPAGQRVITIEDAAELRLQTDHVVRLEARPANAEGVGQITTRDLLRNALRMRPDRIVIGEVRGGEAIELIQAMNTGHEGSLSTCHANRAVDALRRVETMALLGEGWLAPAAVRAQVVSAVDLVIHLGRAADGQRSVVEIAEVVEADGLRVRPLYEHGRMVALPERSPRRPDVPPADRSWLAA
jgi:pilus assembly protein CpaF